MNMGDLNVEIWLFILQSGNWWSSLEIDREFQFKPGTSRRRLHDMQQYGTLEKKQVQGTRSVKFAVTATCMVPRGVSVGKAQVRRLTGEPEEQAT